jgi:phosphoribosylglycinamide formyltransferase-1
VQQDFFVLSGNEYKNYFCAMKKICVFASGKGTNALNIIRYFQDKGVARVTLILCNRPDAGIIPEARKLGIPVALFSKETFYATDGPLNQLKESKIDFIVLAGFLWLLPPSLVQAYPNKIVNIHPALLPKFGGKGMYGKNVHEAVVAASEKESGITIHYVNEHYDKGDILLQKTCMLEAGETADTLALKIRELEHRHYPLLIETLLKDQT